MSARSLDRFDVFLSHAHLDADEVESLAVKLEDNARLRVWLDRWVLVPGKHWQQEMAKGLNQATTCAVCIGQNTPSGWFREEIERALNRQTKNGSFRVIPVILPGGDASIIDNFLELRTWVDFRKGIQDEHAFHVLVSGIKGKPPGRNLYRRETNSVDLEPVRMKLKKIRILRDEQLIDDSIALQYQSRLLDEIL